MAPPRAGLPCFKNERQESNLNLPLTFAMSGQYSSSDRTTFGVLCFQVTTLAICFGFLRR